jgi:DNA-binding IscR family transcriptional regulator
LDCSIRSLWQAVQVGVDQVLSHTTLRDLLGKEQEPAAAGLVTLGQTRPSQPQYGLQSSVSK